MKTYRMSSAGTCPKVLTAIALGYEAKEKSTIDDEIRLRYYTRCEDLASAQMTDEGLEVEVPGFCDVCPDSRHGFHVSIESTLFSLVGHMDRRVKLDGAWFPVEIKSLGRFSWSAFKKGQFAGFQGYAAQEACYLHAENKPGVYWVLNRDSGQYLKYLVNDTDKELNLPSAERITLPITFSEVEDNLNLVELSIAEKELPEVKYDDRKCQYCDFDYLCIKDKTKTVKVSDAELVKASKMWVDGKEMSAESEALLEQAKEILLRHAKTKDKKYQVGRVSVSYLGERSKNYVDESLLKSLVTEDILSQVYKPGKAWDDLRIRIRGEK